MQIKENDKEKFFISPEYNYYFNKETGLFARWGADIGEDPEYSPFGCEILDIEISINGCPNGRLVDGPNGGYRLCQTCYKDNTDGPPTNMSFETFKAILDKMPRSLVQVAFGISGVQTNPDFIRMMEYSREKGIIPNFTLSGIDLTDEIAEKCAKLVGAVAVSAYASNKNICYDTVKKFTDLGLKQVNIHLCTSSESLPFVYEVLNDRLTDDRLKNMNAVVFLGIKEKGRAKGKYTVLGLDEYKKLIEFCFKNKISIGFDSCSAPKFEAVVQELGLTEHEKTRLTACSESCESAIFSGYINVFAKWFPCSFSEGECGFEGIDVLTCTDFVKDIWHSDDALRFRAMLAENTECGCRHCPIFELDEKLCST